MVRGWGGSASMLHSLHGALTELGHSVEVVSAHRDSYGLTTEELPFDCVLTFGPEKREGETTFDELDSSMLLQMANKAAEKLEHRFIDAAPDLILANHIGLMAPICARLHQKFGTPYRLIAYGTDTKLLLSGSRFVELFGEAARAAERIFAISEFVADEARQAIGATVEVIGGAVDSNLFFRSEPRSLSPRRLVYVGRLVTEKGIWILLDAMARGKSATELWLVGEGPLRGEIEQFLSGAPEHCAIKALGYVPQEVLRELLVECAAMVVPSIWEEPLGFVVLEGLACGLPVIATAVGGIPEMIQDGKNGLLVRPNDARALAEAIDRLLGDSDFYERIRRAVNETRVPTYHDLALRVIG